MTAPLDRLTDLGLAVRRPVLDDDVALQRLQATIDEHDYGSLDMSVEDVRAELAETELSTDAWLVHRPESPGEPVAYALLKKAWQGMLEGQVAVDPAWRGRGIGSALAGELESRAREVASQVQPGLEVQLRGWANGESEPQMAWARELGFQPVRRFLRMRIELAERPPAPSWPDGITVRTFEPGRDERATYEASEDSFSDHWGHVKRPFEEWVKRTQRHDFDPQLWLLAMDGDRVVGTSTNSIIPVDQGWISGLGVVRSHRRRGIARALLLQAFNDFWDRGLRAVGLGVDADSLTGATGLYESVGMRVIEAHDQVRKVLRAAAS